MSDSSRETKTLRPRRSVLFMPASNPRAMDKARGLPADALVFDLEDAVAPEAKTSARAHLAQAIRAGGYGARELVVRINALDGRWGADDVAAVAELAVDAVLLPKVESAAQVHAAIEALARAGAPRSHAVWAMIETPRGVLGAPAIAAAGPRLACLVLGTSDLGKDLRVGHTPDRLGFLVPLSLCVLAARAHDLDVLDGVWLDLEDDEGFRRVCEQGREIGFDGKTLIHPKQIAPCNEIFMPRRETVENAAAILDAWEEARAEGRGVAVVNGRLVERLHVEEARRTLALVEAIVALERQATHRTRSPK